jgi:hypothetical protein
VFRPAKQKDEDGKETNVEDASEVINDKGEVFRYNKEGENTSCRPYSEIGFYKKSTLWSESVGADKNGNPVYPPPPKVDRITTTA